MNGQETEVKFFVQDLKKIETRLLELEARLIQARTHEINYRFDRPDGSMRKSSQVLRLRLDTEAKLTYKGPSRLTEGGVMTRKEIEFSVSDFDNAKEFLVSLGYQPRIFYEKFRTIYELKHTHIMLDELPYGTFIEVEGDNAEEIQETVHNLGLKWENMIRMGYHAIFDVIASKYGLDASQLSFDNVKETNINLPELMFKFAD